MGFQETVAAYAWIALGSAFGFLAILVVVVLDGSLTMVVLASVGGPVVAAALNAAIVFGRSRPWLRPRWRYVSWSAAKMLMRAGGMWLAIQTATTISYQSDALVISHVLGPTAVTAYSIPMRLFLFVPALMSFALLPMWPAIRSALARHDVCWVRRIFKRMTFVATIAVVATTLVLLVSAPRLIDLWTSGEIESSRSLLIALALWAVTTCLVTPIAFLLAGVNALRFQMLTNGTMAVLNLGMSIPLAHLLGVEGVAYATVAANVVCIILPSLWYIPRVFARLDQPREDPGSV
jgi:O-antigen/teichoic acid export membrane protein